MRFIVTSAITNSFASFVNKQICFPDLWHIIFSSEFQPEISANRLFIYCYNRLYSTYF